jgi:S1-C subfamily serine protease
MRRFLSFGPAFVVLLTGAVTLILIPGAIRGITAATSHANVTLAQQSLDQDDVLERMNRAVRNIATAVEPSVVHLEVYQGDRRGMRGSSGSGWVYDTSGHIVTNAHVVADSGKVLVQFFDGHVADAEVVGADPISDIAVLKVENGADLEPARRATGVRIERGDRVYAFGSPFGFKFSMSEGIVSGLGRSARTMLGFTGISNFIQTDAAVNPGNSGGPLVDVHGKVVGMNVAIATAQNASGTSEGQSAGISFAIPLATIESRVDQLIAGKPIESGFLGVGRPNFIDPSDIDRRGFRIATVTRGGAADKAGLKPGDVIAEFDGQPVPDWTVLQSQIKSARPGQTVKLKVYRGQEELNVQATLGAMTTDIRNEPYRLALTNEYGLLLRNRRDGGVAVLAVDGTAAEAGFEKGQLFTAVTGEKVATDEDVISKLIDHGFFVGKPVKVTVRLFSEDKGESTTSDIEMRMGGK